MDYFLFISYRKWSKWGKPLKVFEFVLNFVIVRYLFLDKTMVLLSFKIKVSHRQKNLSQSKMNLRLVQNFLNYTHLIELPLGFCFHFASKIFAN